MRKFQASCLSLPEAGIAYDETPGAGTFNPKRKNLFKKRVQEMEHLEACTIAYSVWTSVARPERPMKTRSWILEILWKSVAIVCSCTPSLRSLAMAKQFFPTIATTALPLYSKICIAIISNNPSISSLIPRKTRVRVSEIQARTHRMINLPTSED